MNFLLNILPFKVYVYVDIAAIGSLKYNSQTLNKYFYHMLVKFEQNQRTWTIQNLELSITKGRLSLTNVWHIVAAIWKMLFEGERCNYAKLWIKRLAPFIIPNIAVVMTLVSRLKI